MHWVYTPILLPLLASTAAALALSVLLWRHREAPGALPLMLVMLSAAVWSLGTILEIINPTLAGKLVWANVEYAGITLLPVAWLAFAIEYSGKGEWLTRGRIAALLIIPLVTNILVWTNDYHGLMRADIHLALDGPYPYVAKVYGPWFWIHTLYSYTLLLVGAGLLLQFRGRAADWFSGQLLTLILAIVLPWLANMLYVFQLLPFHYVDLTPIAFTLSGILLGFGFFHYWLLELVPVARGVVIDNMSDGVIVLDSHNRILDANAASAAMIGKALHQLIGKRAERALSDYPDLVEKYRNVSQVQGEIVVEKGGSKRFIDIVISPLQDHKRRLLGRVVVLRDITERKRAELELQAANAALVATLEATADGILVVNEKGEIVRMNRKLAEMLHIPLEDLSDNSHKPDLDMIVQQLIHPDTFYLLMEKLNAFPDAESYDVLELKDGRVFERYSRPQRVGNVRVGRVWSFHDITEQRRAEEELRYLSSHDILTGLFNRGFFEEELNRLENSRQFPVSLILADVDGLKAVNDTYGHLAGDKLLRQAAEILRAACRAEDVVARIGGDEFGILLPESGPQVAENVIERIQNMLAIRRVGETEVPLSLSLGTATAESGDMLRKVVRMADNAMYRIKRSKPGARPGTGSLEL